MTVTVVVVLKPIDIYHHQPQRLLQPAGTLPFRQTDNIVKTPPVGQLGSGQSRHTELFQLLIGLF